MFFESGLKKDELMLSLDNEKIAEKDAKEKKKEELLSLAENVVDACLSGGVLFF